MNRLPHNLRKNGFDYTQLLRNDKIAIYEQSSAPGVRYFEVFIIHTQPERIFNGKIIHSGEVYPSNEDFGKTAWSCRTLDDAIIRSLSLIGK